MSICKEWVGKKQMFIPTCDICGAQLHEQYYFTDAVEEKKNAGWHSKKIDGEWIDMCPDCQIDRRNNK